jgi:beta-barrel assembly-enhancing protease
MESRGFFMLKPTLVFGLTFALTALPALSQGKGNIDLPQLGSPADLVLSPQEEAKISEEVMAELYAYDYIVDDEEVTEYLSTIGWKLASADTSTPNPPNFRFFLMADNRINAFALPGGFIGYNAGTIVAADSESELASVLAHEESHVTQRHAARAAGDTQAADIATWIGVLAAIIAGSANPNVVMGALSVGQGINYQRHATYSRANEMEADNFGMRKLAAAGYDPSAMAGFFSKLSAQSRLYGNRLPEILLDHPVDTTRIAEATERAAQYPQHKVVDSIDFSLMKARTRVLESDSLSEAVGYFAGELNAGRDTPGNHYGYAMALANISRNDEALATLQPLLAEYPRQPNVLLMQAQVLGQMGRTTEALDVYSHAVSYSPRYSPAILKYAEALINAGKPEQARALLINYDQTLANRPDKFKLLSTAARAVNNTAEAQYEYANYLFQRGDLRGAIEQLNAGLRVASISEDDRARLTARRKQMINTIPKDELKQLQRG